MANIEDSAVIKKAKADYASAQAKGDKAGMEAAHSAAESARASAGYSGGIDGSQYISIGNSKPTVPQQQVLPQQQVIPRIIPQVPIQQQPTQQVNNFDFDSAFGNIINSMRDIVDSNRQRINYNGLNLNPSSMVERVINQPGLSNQLGEQSILNSKIDPKLSALNRLASKSNIWKGY